MSRPPRIKLPPSWQYVAVAGQVAPGRPLPPGITHALAGPLPPGPLDPQARGGLEAVLASVRDLAVRTATLLESARPFTSRLTPGARWRALAGFREALDALAAYLTRWYGVQGPDDAPERRGEIHPPCNFPPTVQNDIVHLAELVQQVQDWDARQPADHPPEVLPADLLAAFEAAAENLRQQLTGLEPAAQAALEPAEAAEPPPCINRQSGAVQLAAPTEEVLPVDKITQAIGLRRKHPDWTAKRIAREVGCTPANLSQSKDWQAVEKAIRSIGQQGARREGKDRRAMDRGGKHRGSDMDQYADSPGGQLGLVPVPKCVCGDPAGTDAAGRPLTDSAGRPRCAECWNELTGET